MKFCGKKKYPVVEDNKCVKLVAEDVILTKTNEEENPLNVAAYSVN